MLAKLSKVDGSVALHKEYKHSKHEVCQGTMTALGVQTIGRDSFRNIVVGQPTCIASVIGAYVMKASSSTGEFLRAKLFSFTSLEFRTDRMMVVDGEDNVHVIMG